MRRHTASLLAPLLASQAMEELFSARAFVQAMLDFEAALAVAGARAGRVPEAAVTVIRSCCDAARFDLTALGEETAVAGNPAIPLVKQLTARVAQADADAARFVHLGATSQDVIDTALMLCSRCAIDQLLTDVAKLSDELARLADEHRTTVMAGRTLLQHAVPITFGVKVAGWLAAALRHRKRLAGLRTGTLALQFGGAAGTLGTLAADGPAVEAALAQELRLPQPDLPWHTQRDRVAEIGTTLGLLVGSLGKMARDVALLMQTEVGEVRESAGENQGGSSTLPQKRNPVSANIVLAAALRAPALCTSLLTAQIQEHERAVGAWHAEWSVLPELFSLAGGALRHSLRMIEGLDVNATRMRDNLELTHGLIFAEAVSARLTDKLGRSAAHDLVRAASRRAEQEQRHLRDVLAETSEVRSVLSTEALNAAFEPSAHLGSSAAFIDRVLQAHREQAGA